ncbi:hypothetical protein AC578_7770 [Pseudocercospora eumusae]|uniref:Uncharacterized protein n=1 Tax=Pseudocercospora eumusae TaxID=321146 RepID=A0A139H0X3_9PEZI|nr:hypothetical protein AC578_7770 [Pseudocercospora eumusae]
MMSDVCCREVSKHVSHMKTITVEKLLGKFESDFKHSILDQEPEHRETKSRTSIFSLSAELRNTIYEIFLVVEPIQLPRWSSGKTETLHVRCIGPRPALLFVSKQVQSETLSIGYRTGPHVHVHVSVGIGAFVSPNNAWSRSSWHDQTTKGIRVAP